MGYLSCWRDRCKGSLILLEKPRCMGACNMRVLPAGVLCSGILMSGNVVGSLGCHWGDNNTSSSPRKGLKQMVSKEVWNYDWGQKRQPQPFGCSFFFIEKEGTLAVGGLERELGKQQKLGQIWMIIFLIHDKESIRGQSRSGTITDTSYCTEEFIPVSM